MKDEKRVPLPNDIPKHKKKSKSKGQPRSKHKHEYKTVLLHSYVEDFRDKEKIKERLSATKVCTICGRIDEIDLEQYERVDVPHPFLYLTEKTIKDPETLEDWYADGWMAKFAYKKEEQVLEE